MPPPDMTAIHPPAAGAREPLSAAGVTRQIVAGDIPVAAQGFRPRDDLLAELDRGSARVSVIYPVSGLRGLGATQLAAAYARAKQEAGWRLVAWVHCADTGSLLAGLAAVAEAAGLTAADPGRGPTAAAAAVRDWLETDGYNCLLVFDDVSDPEALDSVFRPAPPSADHQYTHVGGHLGQPPAHRCVQSGRGGRVPGRADRLGR